MYTINPDEYQGYTTNEQLLELTNKHGQTLDSYLDSVMLLPLWEFFKGSDYDFAGIGMRMGAAAAKAFATTNLDLYRGTGEDARQLHREAANVAQEFADRLTAGNHATMGDYLDSISDAEEQLEVNRMVRIMTLSEARHDQDREFDRHIEVRE